MAVNDRAEGWRRKTMNQPVKHPSATPDERQRADAWLTVSVSEPVVTPMPPVFAPAGGKGRMEVRPDGLAPRRLISAVSDPSHPNDSNAHSHTRGHASVICCHGNSCQHEQRLLVQS